MLVHCRVTLSTKFGGWWEALWEKSFLAKNTAQYPWPGVEPGLLDPAQASALTMRPLRLRHHHVNLHYEQFLFRLARRAWRERKPREARVSRTQDFTRPFFFLAIYLRSRSAACICFEWGPNHIYLLFLQAVRSETGSCNETMTRKTWDVDAFIGQRARVRLIDVSSASWGHINFDDLKGDITCDQN